MTREVVLDTPKQQDCRTQSRPSSCRNWVSPELINHIPTGRIFHTYLNPHRDVPQDAYAVHGLSSDFLKDHPPFKEMASLFLEFIEESPLIIHNAKFDMKFLNAELKGHDLPEIPVSRAIDTLIIARKKFPGSPASLDALCKRFGVDNKARDKHGALLDAELLAQVYLELIGGKQPALSLDFSSKTQGALGDMPTGKTYRAPRSFVLTPRGARASARLGGSAKKA